MTDLDRSHQLWPSPATDRSWTRGEDFGVGQYEAPTGEPQTWPLDGSELRATPPPQTVVVDPPVWPQVPQITPTPDPLAPARTRKQRLFARVAVGMVIAVLLGGTVSGWVIANGQASTAAKWRQSDLIAVAANQKLTSTLAAARTSILGLDGQVVALQSQVTGLNSQLTSVQLQLASSDAQLSAVANQKAKVQDQNAVLNKLVGAAGTVSSMLQKCVTDSNSVWSQLVGDINAGTILTDYTLDANIKNVTTECNAAETANRQLQSVITSTAGGQ